MKQTLVISCPASSRSGYGDHARDIVRSFMAMDRFDIKILSSGYSDIKNAVFLEIKNNFGYLYQYSQKGVNYKCRKL